MQKGKLMKKNLMIAGAFMAAMFVITSVNSAKEEEKKVDLKCPVSGKAVTKKVSAAYKGADVYVCCKNCKKAVESDPSKFTTKINHQLVQTKQAKNVKCPFAGKKLNPATKLTIADADVAFCCNGCKGKVVKLNDEEKQIEMVFNDKAFKKGFEIVKKEE